HARIRVPSGRVTSTLASMIHRRPPTTSSWRRSSWAATPPRSGDPHLCLINDGYAPRMRIVLLAVVAAVLAGCGSSGGKPSASELAPVRTPYSPKVDPAAFVKAIDNPLLPFRPGTTFLYRGVRGRTPQVDEEIVTGRTEEILGVAATVVRDTVSEGGRPIERTLDFYAQDKDGNVWYLGEDSFELEHGRFVKASDSWRSGVD